ncbi:MAG: chemotaxis protein CheX [Pirellulales bacterium]|nr:chemotaxis protein CheX [Pirellulales bacterium]
MSCHALVPFNPLEVGQLIETVWTVVLGCDVRPVSVPTDSQRTTNVLAGIVEITGAWEGVVALECPLEFVRQAAATMFEVEPALLTSDQLEDALGELTNIVGGNFKALLPASAHLGLPAVVKNSVRNHALAGATVLEQLAFETSGFVFVLSILGATSAALARLD